MKSWAALVWGLVVVALLMAGSFSNVKFSSSIFALLPESNRSPLVRHASDLIANDFSKQLMLIVAGDDALIVRNAVKALASKLTVLDEVAEVRWQADASEMDRYRNELFPYRFGLITADTRRLLLAGEYESLSERALKRIFGLLSLGQNTLVDDPFALYSASGSTGLNIEISHSMLKVVGAPQPSYLLALTLRDEPYDPEVQNSILGVIQDQIAASDVTIEQSGMLLHAAAGARQANREISTIGLGSLIGIALLVLWVFRKPSSLGLMLIPVVVGYLSAVAVTALVFTEVHLVTLAFGMGLVGVSIDYALHFLCERRVCPDNKILPRLLPGLLLGLFSSVVAYAALALAPFPGLRQMAVFSVSGLIFGWLTVVLWYPMLTRKQALNPLPAANWLSRVSGRLSGVGSMKTRLIGLIVMVILSVASINTATSIDDVRLLQTSPAELVAMERRVRQALGIESSSQFILVKSSSIDESLRQEEVLLPELDALKQTGLLDNYQALSMVLPSLSRQGENAAMVSALYDDQLEPLYSSLGLDETKVTMARDSFDTDNSARLTAEKWQQTTISQQWQNYLVTLDSREVASVIRLTGLDETQGQAHLEALIENTPNWIFIDRSRDISTLMAKYRIEIANWVVAAYLLVFVVLALRYRQNVWRIILPPALAAIVTLALLVQFEQGINLFHLMALILVLGIGLDMGIFMTETDGSAHTWLAVSLSAVTSLLAFGLLALSKTPVLHHFGMTVLLGLGLVWLLVLVIQKPNVVNV